MLGARTARARDPAPAVGFVEHASPDRARSPAKAMARSHSLGCIGLGITNGEGERTMVPDAASTMPRVSRAAVRCDPCACAIEPEEESAQQTARAAKRACRARAGLLQGCARVHHLWGWAVLPV